MIKIFQLSNCLTADGIAGPKTLSKMMDVFEIPKPAHMAHYMGQTSHETGNFTKKTESLNYSVDGLKANFGTHRISSADCEKYGRKNGQPANQEAIGNLIYGGEWGRKNLGNTKPGDGFLFRGRGGGQTTGRYNYQLLSDFVKDPEIMKNPELVNEKYYFQSALFFFTHNKLWKYCDQVDEQSILTVSRAINLGNPFSSGIPKGMIDRVIKTNHYKKLCAS